MKALTLSIVLGALAGLGCGGSDGTTPAPAPKPDPMTQAEAKFWDAFLDGDIGAVPAARDEMLAAFDPSSGDYEGARFIGMSYLLSVAEGGLGGGGPPAGGGPPMGGGAPMFPAAIATYFDDAVKYTALAANIAPASAGVTDRGHEADALYAAGLVTRDASLVEQARTLLQNVVIPAYPIYGYLTEAPVFVGQPASTPDFATGLGSLFLMIEACTGTRLDRDHPDVTAMLGKVRDPDCGNGKPHIPHNLEGTLLMFGDSLVKGGKPDAARPVYETVTKTEGYAEWPLRSVVESRLSADLDALAAAYLGPDPPAVGSSTHPCLQCHQR
jgi:hypothetical protein